MKQKHLHGIARLSKTVDGRIHWDDEHIENFSYENKDEEREAANNLAAVCELIEAKKEEVTASRVGEYLVSQCAAEGLDIPHYLVLWTEAPKPEDRHHEVLLLDNGSGNDPQNLHLRMLALIDRKKNEWRGSMTEDQAPVICSSTMLTREDHDWALQRLDESEANILRRGGRITTRMRDILTTSPIAPPADQLPTREQVNKAWLSQHQSHADQDTDNSAPN